ncbi:hypothetical protein B0H14DRAFT_622950 [Mycena olivaceomarginata]|nr:hypothetical protein B0H14DRAFT_622950 [Mycena olivaceomarginata]
MGDLFGRLSSGSLFVRWTWRYIFINLSVLAVGAHLHMLSIQIRFPLLAPISAWAIEKLTNGGLRLNRDLAPRCTTYIRRLSCISGGWPIHAVIM